MLPLTAVALGCLAVLLAWPVPWALHRAAWPRRDPLVALVCWQAIGLAGETNESIRKEAELFDKASAAAGRLAKLAASQVGKPYAIYDRRITARLGTPVEEVRSNRITAQLFHVKAQHFNGYALKVKLKSNQAMRMVLGKDTYGGAETTLILPIESLALEKTK